MLAASDLHDHVAQLSPPARRILIDGPSGAGKTTLAQQLAPLGYLILHLDDWYPGWDGLAAGSALAEELLTSDRPAFPRWDWAKGRVSEWVPVDPTRPWVVEGCGSLTPGTAALADLRLWCDVPAEVAHQRGLARDGAAYEPWWERWHRQEQQHWERHRPWTLADIRVDCRDADS